MEVLAYSGTVGALYAGVRAYHGPGSGLVGPGAAMVRGAEEAGRGLWPPGAPPASESAVGTFLGMDDEQLVDRMRHAEFKSLRFNRGGSSVSFRVEFADGSRASFKPNQINPQSVPRKEVAAYRLNRLLGLNLVPPATMRSVPKEVVLGRLAPESAFMRPRVEAETTFENGAAVGSLSYWVPTLIHMGLDTPDGISRWEHWLSVDAPIPADKVQLMAQLSTLLVFDLIQNNSDRFSGGNLLGAPEGKSLYFMDNAFGFQTDAEGHQKCRSYVSRAQKFSRRFIRALQRLDLRTLKQAMRPEGEPSLLSDEEMEALLGRRDRALRHVNELIARYGEERVLVFP